MTYTSPALDQGYFTAEPGLFTANTNVIWVGAATFRFDTDIFSKPIEQSLSSRPWTATRPVRGSDSCTDLAGRVRSAVTDILGEGIPTLSSIALKIGIGTRTLQRRLSASGHSFQGIVDMARRDLALRLLCETELCLAEIALLTGFSEQSGFTRAFKRWAGQTPRSYRLETSSVRPSRSDVTGQDSGVSEQELASHFSYPLT